MVRPDALADGLGFAGFLLAGVPGATALVGGAGLLALAILTKQTAGIYALAAVAALLVGPARAYRRAALLAGAVAGGLLSAVVAGYMAGEPRLLSGLMAQGQFGYSVRQLATVLGMLNRRSPELVWFALMGLSLWLARRGPERRLAALTLCLLPLAVLTASKMGSDLNYFLCLRPVAALGAAALCEAILKESLPRRRAAGVVLLSLALAVPSLWVVGRAAAEQVETAWRSPSPDGRSRRAALDEAIRMARDGRHPILTDCDALGVYQAGGAPLLDPFLFRLRVQGGRLDPGPLIERIERGQFSALILSADPAIDYPETYFWKLPHGVAASIAGRYRFERQLGPWLVYVPR
jgi:hypothetical protein